MPLATRNNALIVKDGKVAENCGCCAGWYCCEDRIGQCRDRLGDVLKLTATISAQDYKKHDLVSGCQLSCSWGSGTYIWPGSSYAGTFVLTPRKAQPPDFFLGSSAITGVWWIYEHFFPAEQTGCTGANLSVWVNVRVPGDPLQTTPSTRLQIFPLLLAGRSYRYLIYGSGSPNAQTKDLSDMKCQSTLSGSTNCSGGTYEFYDSAAPQNTGNGTPLFNSQTYLGLCSIDSPINIVGQSINLGNLGTTSCGYDAGGGPSNYSIISETGSRNVSGSLLVEQV
jgi:hypothetical protein